MEERAQRIVDAAIELAEQGGFQAVRLRDVASQSGVALGTLYARFSSKEDILIAALEQETSKFEELIRAFPMEGENPFDRVFGFFGVTSRALFDRPNFAKAVLRSVASGVPGISDKVIRYQHRMNSMIVQTLRGTKDDGEHFVQEPSKKENLVAFLMQQIWFAALVSWMSGSETEDAVIEHTAAAARLILSGANWPETGGPVSDDE